jgi:hypothetical protein
VSGSKMTMTSYSRMRYPTSSGLSGYETAP